MLIREIPISERPRERLMELGVECLSNEELLSIILRCGTKSKSIRELSLDILKEIGQLDSINDLTLNRALEIKGIGIVKASQLIAVIELARRISNKKNLNIKKIKSSCDVYDEIKDIFKNKKQEEFYCLYFNAKQQIIDKKLLFIGTVNKSLVHPREVFKYAYLHSATSIICIHNHPSGDATPSIDDIEITNILVEIGKLQKIPVIDHIIVGDNNYYSFKDNSDI